MKLESQVVSLELSKRLKELGVKQHSLFKWNFKFDEKGKAVYTELIYFPIDAIEMDIAAYTVAELGEMLPYRSKKLGTTNDALISFNKIGSKYRVFYYDEDEDVYSGIIEATDTGLLDSEADARAKMLIYLIENNLITL